MQTVFRKTPIQLKPAYSPKPAARNAGAIRAADSPSPSPSEEPVSPKALKVRRLTAARSIRS